VYPAPVGSPGFIELDDDDRPVLPEVPVEVPKTKWGRSVSAVRKANRNASARRQGGTIQIANPDTVPDEVDTDVVTTADDLAAVVVRRTLKGIASGKLQPTLRDGIAAQSLLDKRAEKAADRQFMLNLVTALAGGGAPVPQKLLPPPDDDVIEGDFDDISLAPSHLRAE
jgi:hypothetical protein